MFFRRAALASGLVQLFVLSWVVAFPVNAAPSAQRDAQEPPAATQSEGRGSNAGQPYIFERHSLAVRFENDGSGQRELSVRVRIQNEQGAQQFRELAFGYVSPNEQVTVRSVKVRKHDGSSIDVLASPKSIEEGLSATAREYPAYANLKEVRVALPSLQTGDTLEYDVVTRVVQPFAPGEFWFQYDFPRDAIVLDDRLELNMPQGRAFRIKAPGFTRIEGGTRTAAPAKAASAGVAFTRTEEGGRTILRWKRANLKIAGDQEQSPLAAAERPPDVQLTSFKDWASVARWYAQFEHASPQASAQVKSKAEELIRGATSDTKRPRALCAYVSQQIRNVDSPALFGRLPARTPESVLASGYGDPEEKTELMAAMLEAVGMRADTVLISYRRKLERDFPSPAQFDHAIAAVYAGQKTDWVDPSAQLAPFGFLPAPLRGESALLIGANGSAEVVKTPADPPFPSTQNVEIEAQVSGLGKLSGTARYSLRGDTEYVLRTAFHRAPRAQWNQLAQTILTLDGLRGEATSVTTSDPLDTEKPFQLTIAFSDPSAFEWPMERARIAVPLLNIALPDPPTKRGEPVKLGTPLDIVVHLRLRLPPGFRVSAPVGTAVARDYAEFKSSYRFEKGELLAERALKFKLRELPASQIQDYLAFSHAVQADEAQPLDVENPAGSKAEIPSNASPDDLLDAGAAALKAGNTRGAVLLLQRVTQLQAGHKSAWNELGLAYLQAHRFNDAAAAFQKQAQVNPSDTRAHDYLGVALEELHRDDDAANAFRKQTELQPLDPIAHAQLGNILLKQQRYSEAIPELEKAAILSPGNAELQILLGRANLSIGDRDKALASFQKAVQLSPAAQTKNAVAYSLAEQGTDLDLAQQYAESAIRSTAADLEKADLAHASAADLTETSNLGAYWDTLGRIYFRKGDAMRAKPYLRAAWQLTQSGETGDHLAQLYQKLGDKQRAIEQCALALASTRPVPDTRARLMLLLGGNAQIDELVRKARPELERMRTYRVKLPVRKKASAEFLIAMSPGGKAGTSARVDAVRFAGGDESLRQFATELKSIDYGEELPDATPLKLIRRGTLTCSAAEDTCKFTLAPAEDAVVKTGAQ